LQGSTLRQDLDDNEALYRKKQDNKEIVNSRTLAAPAASRKFQAVFSRYSPREKKS
jgi:hypothetical protein